MRNGIAAGLFAVAMPLTPAAAQSQTADAETAAKDIIVTGKADQPQSSEVVRQARAITRPQNVYDLPLARFEDRFCPGVMGLTRDYAEQLIDRLRYNARQLDMWMNGEAKCSPNFVVAFVRDGKREIADLERAHPELFDTLPLHERRELLAEDGPVHVWTTTATRTRDGMPIPRAQGLTDPPVTNMWMAHSKIYLATREDITSVLVVFDLEGAKGKTLVQLADYATMRGLARTRPAEDGQAMDTILALFDPQNAPPSEMTGFDRAYLGAIYDGIPNIAAITKILGVSRQLRRASETEEEER